MRKTLPILLSAFLVVAMVGCEGPEGPAGDDGIAGPAGPQGPQGPAGQDAVNTCSDCHDSDITMMAIQQQYEASAHGLSGTYVRTGSCSRCHNHDGFTAFVEDGTEVLAIGNPTPINCRTCHDIHETFTSADYALTTTEPIDFIYPAGVSADFDTGNLCATCHMARAPGVVPVPGGPAIEISGSRFGTHYGTQSNTMAAAGYFTFGTVETANPHMVLSTCNECHMAGDAHSAEGFHKFTPTTDSCVGSGCHFSMNDGFRDQDVVAALMTQLQTLLIGEGILVDETSHYGTPGTYDQDVIAAFLNWFMLNEDGSLGVHNPYYVIDVLNNTIAMLEARQAV